MKSVSHIFGNEAKVKIMRLFVFNRESHYTPSEVSERTQEKRIKVSKELRNLVTASLIRKRRKGFVLNKSYPHIAALEHFLVEASPLKDKEIIKRVSKAGSIKLLLISGVFLHDPEARVDILVVGDHLKQNQLLSIITKMEAALGRELRYTSFDTVDFQYRYGLYDKLVRDIIDYPHQKLVNKLGI